MGNQSNLVMDSYKRLPSGVKMVVEVTVAGLILGGVPLLLYHYVPGQRNTYYSPYDLPPPSSIKREHLVPELERWGHLVFVIVCGWIISNRLSEMVVWMTGKVFRKHRGGLKQDAVKFLEFAMHSTAYLMYFLTTVMVWVAVRALFPVPVDPRWIKYLELISKQGNAGLKPPKIPVLDRPRYFHLDRFAFVGVFCSVCLLVEHAILHSLTMYFGQTVYKERVAQCNYRLWVVKMMSQACKRHKPIEGGSASLNLNPTRGGILAVYPGRQDDVSAFILEHAGAAQGTKESLADHLFDHFLSVNSAVNSNLSSSSFVIIDDDSHQETQTTFNPKQQADTLSIQQLKMVFDPEELKRAFAIFDPTESGTASREEFRRAISETFQERWAIINGVTGHGKMVNQLDRFMKRLIMALTVIFVFFAYGIRMDNLTRVLTFLMIPASRALKTFFSAITYIFTTHPYDVGDRVTVQGVHFFVQHVGLLFTKFRRSDGAVLYYPNYLLATLAVNNIKRAPRQSIKFELVFDSESASPQKIGLLRQKIQEALNKARRDFSSGQTWFLQMPDATKISLCLVLHHTTNQQEGHPWAMRNSAFLETVKEITEDLGLVYRPPVRTLIAEEDINTICVE